MGVDIAIGASDHYARAELVTLALRDDAPVFLDRRRVELIAEGLPIAPYHHEALELELAEATALVQRVKQSVEEHARAAIASVLDAHPASALVLPASPYDSLPDSLEEILASRHVTNAADGMLYREALAEAAAAHDLKVHHYPRKADPAALAAEAMGVDLGEVHSLVAQFGKQAGSPWRKDHKLAAAAALSVLAG